MIHRREELKLISMDIVLQMSSCNITCATGGVLHKCLKAVYREVASSCHVSKGCVMFSSPVIPRGTGLEYGESPFELVFLFFFSCSVVVWMCLHEGVREGGWCGIREGKMIWMEQCYQNVSSMRTHSSSKPLVGLELNLSVFIVYIKISITWKTQKMKDIVGKLA